VDYADNEVWQAWMQEGLKQCFQGQKGVPMDTANILPGRIAMSVGSVSTMSKDSGYTAPTKRIVPAPWSGNPICEETRLETRGGGIATTMSELQASIFESSCIQQVALEDEFWDLPMVRETGLR
jgi:hypothetical protein